MQKQEFQYSFYFGRIILYFVLTIILIVSLFPFMWMVSTALRESYSLLNLYLSPIPNFSEITLVNFLDVFRESPFIRWLLNSIILASSVTVSNIFVSSLAGYVFAKKRFWGKEFIFFLILATMMIPFQATIIPLFILMVKFGWVNTYQGMIAPGIADAFGVFLMRQFISGIPSELEDAAKLDGCGNWRIFFSIILPLSKPALVSLAILQFLWWWNTFLWPLVITNSEKMRTLTVGVTIFQGRYLSNWGMIMAVSTLSLIPMVVIYLSLQKFFIKGITIGGLKG